MRLSATRSLFERRDVIIVASVSCIYGLGSPEAYYGMMLPLEMGQRIEREQILRKLVDIQYERNDVEFGRGTFRVRGDIVEVYPSYEEQAVRIGLFGDEVDELVVVRPADRAHVAAPRPDRHLPEVALRHAARAHAAGDRVDQGRTGRAPRRSSSPEGKLLEAQRLHQRTMFDLEMIREIGYCHGIENYARHLTGRAPGEPPPTLLDYLPADALVFVDESHQTVPQIRGMYHGDRSRKEMLVELRLPPAVGARQPAAELRGVAGAHPPGRLRLGHARARSSCAPAGGVVVEQIIRPTGLTDPPIEIRPVKGQVDDLLGEIRDRAARGERVLVTTLTKRMAEDLTQYYQELGVRVRYLHSDIDTLERVEILRDLRRGEFDVLVGINLLREGLDLPEVSLVAILDADKEGFLRSAGSLIQTSGRAARNVNGRVIMYADRHDRLDARGDRRDRPPPRRRRRPTTRSTASRPRRSSSRSTTCCRACTSATTWPCPRPSRRPGSGRRRSSTPTWPASSARCARRPPTSISSGRPSCATASRGSSAGSWGSAPAAAGSGPELRRPAAGQLLQVGRRMCEHGLSGRVRPSACFIRAVLSRRAS